MVNSLCDILHSRKNLQFVDFSDSCLKPRHLMEITKELADMYRQLRDVTLSYNMLDFNKEDSEDFRHSNQTIEHLKILCHRAKIMNHINLSGMGIVPDKMLSLCEAMSKCALLMGIHLNDNGLTNDFELML